MRCRKLIVLYALLVITAGSGAVAGNGGGNFVRQGGGEISALSPDEAAGLIFMREEEKLARDLYLILFDEWGLAIFSNISKSEQNHTDQVEKLLVAYGVTDPVLDETLLGRFTDPELQQLFTELVVMGASESATAEDGLKAGVVVEETDILDLQERISVTQQSDIIATYENLLCGSRNHLRAFVRQIELRGGGVYSAGILSDDLFEEIVYSRSERCGRRR